MTLPLRHFLYLDDAMVGGFLAQLTGGRVDEEARRLSETRGKRSGGEASVGVSGARIGGRLGRDSADTEERSYTLQQTPDSTFQTFYEALEEAEALQFHIKPLVAARRSRAADAVVEGR
jgi:hypothetical protein